MSQPISPRAGSRFSRSVAVGALIGAAVYFFLIEHRHHVLAWLPYIILLACPLMHILMHGGHSHPDSDGSSNADIDEAYRRGLADGLNERRSQINPSASTPDGGDV